MTDRQRDPALALKMRQALAARGVVELDELGEFVPQDWAGRAAAWPDLDVRAFFPDPDPESGAALLESLGAERRGQLQDVLPALDRQQLSGEAALDALEASHRVSCAAAGARLHAVRELVARTAAELLADKNVTDPAEMSKTARERWRAEAKSVAVREVVALTGSGRGAAQEEVAIASLPDAARRPVEQALQAGLSTWPLVLSWSRRCARMAHEDAALISRALFATGIDPCEAAVERLTPEGELSSRPWAKPVFLEALERLATAVEGADPETRERERAARHAARDAYAIVDDDGTARLVVTGDIVSITGAVSRLQEMAVKARNAGDPRTRSELRSDIARSLLNHGVLPVPDLGGELGLITPDDIAGLVDVLAGVPAAHVNVIVPWDVLTGTPALSVPNVYPEPGATTDEAAGAPAEGTGPPPAEGAGPPPAEGAGSPPSEGTGLPAGGTGDGASFGLVQVLPAVGRLLGRESRFLTAEEVRAIAGRPGTTLHRLLMDPADGRCLERSAAGYAPDAAMRAQILAADVTSRAPGSTVPAPWCDLDHVEEYLLGGPTSEQNLQSLDRPWHAVKTRKFWDAVMDATRNVTWESFWGKVYRTRAHDYRQYLTQAITLPDPGAPAAVPPGEPPTLEEQRHLASLLVYAAIAQRRPGDRLIADDDEPGADVEFLGLREALLIRHTTRDGRRVDGPRPGTPTPERLITHPPREVLDHPDWTTIDDPPEDEAGGTAVPGGATDPDQDPPPF